MQDTEIPYSKRATIMPGISSHSASNDWKLQIIRMLVFMTMPLPACRSVQMGFGIPNDMCLLHVVILAGIADLRL